METNQWISIVRCVFWFCTCPRTIVFIGSRTGGMRISIGYDRGRFQRTCKNNGSGAGAKLKRTYCCGNPLICFHSAVCSQRRELRGQGGLVSRLLAVEVCCSIIRAVSADDIQLQRRSERLLILLPKPLLTAPRAKATHHPAPQRGQTTLSSVCG